MISVCEAVKNKAVKNEADVFDPNLQMEDYAELEPSPPSDEWLLSCATSLANDPEIVKPFPADHRKYRLGDCVKLCNACEYGWDTNKTKIASMYGEAACPCNTAKNLRCNKSANDLMNITKLLEIFEKIDDQDGFVKPKPNDVVMHLRLGDVVEEQKKDVGTLLIEGGTGYHPTNRKAETHDIRSVKEVLDLLNEADELNHFKRQHKLVIVGGSHVPWDYQKSRVYANCLARAVAKAGRKVEMYLDGGNADKDFYFMSHAKFFIESTGGFSMLMGVLAKKLGAIKTWDFTAEYKAYNEKYTEAHGGVKQVAKADSAFSFATGLDP